MAKIKIRKSRMIPYWGRIIGTILMTAFYGWLLQSVSEDLFIGIAIGISPLLPIMWMSFYVLEVNDDEHYWWRYRWILGFKFGTKQSYRQIDHIALREKVITTQRNGEVIRYEGIVVFDDASECPLTRRKDQRFMYEKMNKLAEKVGVDLIVETGREEDSVMNKE